MKAKNELLKLTHSKTVIDFDKQNEKFNALEGLTEGQKHYLIGRNLVVVTEATLNYRKARVLVGKSLGSPFMPRQGVGKFEGRVIVPDSGNKELAKQVVESRQWKEEVVGFLDSKDYTLASPYRKN